MQQKRKKNNGYVKLTYSDLSTFTVQKTKTFGQLHLHWLIDLNLSMSICYKKKLLQEHF